MRSAAFPAVPVILLLLSACSVKDKSPPSASASATPPSSQTTLAAASAPAASASSAAAAPNPSAPKLGEPVPAFKLVEKPAASDIVDGAVQGSANGHKFEAKVIYFENGKDGWEMSITDKPLMKPGLTDYGSQTIRIEFKGNPAAMTKGAKLARAMKYGDGIFEIARRDDPSKTISWNADNAYYVELTKWDAKPYDPANVPVYGFQDAGKASGKIYVVYKGSEDGYKDSGVTGTFTDVPIRYSGKPRWLK